MRKHLALFAAASLAAGSFALVGYDRHVLAADTGASAYTADRTSSTSGRNLPQGITRSTAQSDNQGITRALSDATKAVLDNQWDQLTRSLASNDRTRLSDFNRQQNNDLQNKINQFKQAWRAKYNQDFNFRQEVVFNEQQWRGFEIVQGEVSEPSLLSNWPVEATTSGSSTDVNYRSNTDTKLRTDSQNRSDTNLRSDTNYRSDSTYRSDTNLNSSGSTQYGGAARSDIATDASRTRTDVRTESSRGGAIDDGPQPGGSHAMPGGPGEPSHKEVNPAHAGDASVQSDRTEYRSSRDSDLRTDSSPSGGVSGSVDTRVGGAGASGSVDVGTSRDHGSTHVNTDSNVNVDRSGSTSDHTPPQPGGSQAQPGGTGEPSSNVVPNTTGGSTSIDRSSQRTTVTADRPAGTSAREWKAETNTNASGSSSGSTSGTGAASGSSSSDRMTGSSSSSDRMSSSTSGRTAPGIDRGMSVALVTFPAAHGAPELRVSLMRENGMMNQGGAGASQDTTNTRSGSAGVSGSASVGSSGAGASGNIGSASGSASVGSSGAGTSGNLGSTGGSASVGGSSAGTSGNTAGASGQGMAATSGTWHIDIPDRVDSQKLRTNLARHVDELNNMKDQWPADQNEAYRMVSHHVLMALYDVNTTGGANTSGTIDVNRDRSNTSGSTDVNRNDRSNTGGSIDINRNDRSNTGGSVDIDRPDRSGTSGSNSSIDSSGRIGNTGSAGGSTGNDVTTGNSAGNAGSGSTGSSNTGSTSGSGSTGR